MSVPYPSTKDSGVTWLGEVPAHWNVVPLKHLARFSGGGTPSRDKPAYWNGDIPWVSPKDMKVELISETEEFITAEGLEGSTSALLAPGAVLVVVRSGILRHTIPVAINSKPVALNQDMKAISVDLERYRADYLSRFIQGLNSTLLPLWLKLGATVESIEFSYMADTPVPVPPLSEQAVIAAFLDRETGKTDALVEEQRRLIALLNEKRQAVISHAVTKGLNPQVPLKPSGIEWLGDIPAHWEVRPLKAVSTEPGTVFIDGDWIEAKDISDDGIRYITTGNVGNGYYKEQGAGFISDDKFRELNCTEVFPGDVLISRLNAPVGRACVVPDLGRRIVTSVDNVIVRPDHTVNRGFLVHFLSTKSYLFHTETLARGTTMQRVSRTILGNIRIALPDPKEQAEIARFVDEQIEKLDSLIEEAERGIHLLQERRAVIISAAVTGKIDVRGFISAESQKEPA
ncbi:restriction endonuclease subunit S [Sandarakinorhabdus rubra]|uniref:restriction endonuclease subunit S n=1 Tax=Sandarakinorhabdus rubra TaxID=2672568 RepID=UPI0013DC2191|nr:restriction endonuclease subunit S [Sandarakinorhabdus rubra]